MQKGFWASFGVVLFLFSSCSSNSSRDSSVPNEAPANSQLFNGETGKMARSSDATKYFLDNAGTVADPFSHQPLQVSAGTDLKFRGWAVDDKAQALAGGVEIAVDGKPVKAQYQLNRQDVADAQHNPAYANSGFEAKLPTKELGRGRHLCTIRIISHSGDTYYESPVLTIVIN